MLKTQIFFSKSWRWDFCFVGALSNGTADWGADDAQVVKSNQIIPRRNWAYRNHTPFSSICKLIFSCFTGGSPGKQIDSCLTMLPSSHAQALQHERNEDVCYSASTRYLTDEQLVKWQVRWKMTENCTHCGNLLVKLGVLHLFSAVCSVAASRLGGALHHGAADPWLWQKRFGATMRTEVQI